MLEAVIGGVLGAVGTIIGALIAVLGHRRNDRKVRSIENAAIGSVEALPGFGLHAAYVNDFRTLLDLEGTVEIVRKFGNIKVTEPGTNISYIPGRMRVIPGFLQTPPELLPDIGYEKALKLEIRKSDRQSCEFTVEIQGGLSTNDPELSFGFRAVAEGAVVTTKEEMEKQYKNDAFRNEYVSSDIDVPMDVLELCVEFPPSYNVKCFPAVFIGHSEVMIDRELQRTKDGLMMTETGGARFRVENPVLGFRYAIYWIPPNEDEVARLRKAESKAVPVRQES